MHLRHRAVDSRAPARAADLATSRGLACSRLEPHPQLVEAGRSRDVLDLDVGLAADQLAELGVTVVAGIERGIALDEVRADLAEVGPAVLLRRAGDRGRKHPPEVGRLSSLTDWRLGGLLRFLAEKVE